MSVTGGGATATGMVAEGATRTTTIKASVGAKVLRNATRFFDARVEGVVAELVQNARRAGATRIDFSTRGGDLVVADDGPGLPAEWAHVLLTVGGSANGEGVERAEDAAGIGFFALGNHPVVVESQDWRMSIPREAFVGDGEATLESGRPPIGGMVTTIVGFVEGDGERAPGAIARAAVEATAFGGLRCRLLDMPRVAFVDAPEDTRTRAHPSDARREQSFEPMGFASRYDAVALATRVVEVPGATITIVRHEGDQLRSAVNFFGHVLGGPTDAPGAIRLGEALGLPKPERIGVLVDGHVREAVVGTCVLVDIAAIDALRLKLPDRTALVEDAGLARVRAAIRVGIQDLLRQPGVANGLGWDDPLREGAPGIPPGDLRIRRDGSGNIESRRDLAGGSLLATSDADGVRVVVDGKGGQVDVADVVAGSMSDCVHAMLDTSPEGVAVRVYDEGDVAAALGPGRTRVSGQSFVVRVDGEEVETGVEPFDAMEAEGSEVVRAIEEAFGGDEGEDRVARDVHMRLHVEDAGGTRVWRTVPVGVLYWMGYEGCACVDDVVLVLAEGADLDDAVHAVLCGIDWLDDDRDGGSYDKQRSEWAEALGTRLAGMTGGLVDDVLDRLRRAVDALADEYLRARGVEAAELRLTLERVEGHARASLSEVAPDGGVATSGGADAP